MNINNKGQWQAPVVVKRSQAWEIVAFLLMLASLLTVFFAGLQWGVFVLLLAIYCAAMR